MKEKCLHLLLIPYFVERIARWIKQETSAGLTERIWRISSKVQVCLCACSCLHKIKLLCVYWPMKEKLLD